MCKESLLQYQQELPSANLTDLSSIKRLNYYVSQFSLTTFSKEIGVKIASAAHHSLSHPLFDEIYVSYMYFQVFPWSRHDCTLGVNVVCEPIFSHMGILFSKLQQYLLYISQNANIRIYRLCIFYFACLKSPRKSH